VAIVKKIKSRGKTRYQVRYRATGSRSYRQATFDDESAAHAFAATAGVRRAKLPAATRISSRQTLREFGLEFREKFGDVEQKPSTKRLARQLWNRWILPELGAMPLSRIDSERVQAFKAHMTREGAGAATVRRTLQLLSVVLGKAVEWRRISSNPVAGIKRPSGKRRKNIQTLSPEAMSALIEAMPTVEDKRLTAVLAFAGLRPGEALALRGDRIKTSVIDVVAAVSLGEVGETKTGETRRVPILEPLKPFLTDVPDGLVFARDGAPWSDSRFRNWRRRVWQPACQTVGVGAITETEVAGKRRLSYEGATPYALRHTFGSTLLFARIDPLLVARIMGHSPRVLFQIYAHVLEELAASSTDWSEAAEALIPKSSANPQPS
jgi:integrase